MFSWQKRKKKSEKDAKTGKRSIFCVFRPFLIYVRQPHGHIGWAIHQCPSHQWILLNQGPIHEIFIKNIKNCQFWKTLFFLTRPFCFCFFKKIYIFCFFPIITSQSLLISKNGSKFWSSRMWQQFLTQTKYFAPECNH